MIEEQAPAETPSPERATAELPGGTGNLRGAGEVAKRDPEEQVPRSVLVESLQSDDKRRVEEANAVLAEAGLHAIPEGSVIALDDIPVFRQLVDDANASVKNANYKWMTEADQATRPAADHVMARVRAGDVAGLPVLGPNNSSTRKHPHEAVATISMNGQVYVVRATPDDHPSLSRLGKEYDNEVERRIGTLDTIVRPLFHTSKENKKER